MFFLIWLLLGTGTFLSWSALTGRQPAETVQRLLNGLPIPERDSWMSIRNIGLPTSTTGMSGGVELDATGKVVNKGTGSNVGGVNLDAVGKIAGGGKRQAVIAYAMAQLGERYVFGAAGPDTWDCSGLTMRAYQAVGISLPHNAAQQQLQGTKVANPQPADLVFWGLISGHVGIYLGNGQIIHAPQPGDVVKISPLWDLGSINYRSYL